MTERTFSFPNLYLHHSVRHTIMRQMVLLRNSFCFPWLISDLLRSTEFQAMAPITDALSWFFPQTSQEVLCDFGMRVHFRCTKVMLRAILFQMLATVAAAVGAGIVVGTHGMISAALGGLACTLPNFLFAVHLSMAAKRFGTSSLASFLLGETVKVVATIGLLLLAAKEYSDVHWPSLLVGLVFATQAIFFVSLTRSKSKTKLY